jgi:hypothetical protein
MPRRWHQLGDDASHHAGDGGKKARSPGSTKEAVKTIRAGNAGKVRRTCGDDLVCLSHTKLRVRFWRLAFPAPSDFFEGRCFSKTRACERRGRKSMPEVSAQTRSSCPDLIRASIELHKNAFRKRMDCRVKPGNDKEKEAALRVRNDGSVTPPAGGRGRRGIAVRESARQACRRPPPGCHGALCR